MPTGALDAGRACPAAASASFAAISTGRSEKFSRISAGAFPSAQRSIASAHAPNGPAMQGAVLQAGCGPAKRLGPTPKLWSRWFGAGTHGGAATQGPQARSQRYSRHQQHKQAGQRLQTSRLKKADKVRAMSASSVSVSGAQSAAPFISAWTLALLWSPSHSNPDRLLWVFQEVAATQAPAR